jgi:hypothetical protein
MTIYSGVGRKKFKVGRSCEMVSQNVSLDNYKCQILELEDLPWWSSSTADRRVWCDLRSSARCRPVADSQPKIDRRRHVIAASPGAGSQSAKSRTLPRHSRIGIWSGSGARRPRRWRWSLENEQAKLQKLRQAAAHKTTSALQTSP